MMENEYTCNIPSCRSEGKEPYARMIKESKPLVFIRVATGAEVRVSDATVSEALSEIAVFIFIILDNYVLAS